MNRKIIIRHVSYLLLLAMTFASVPFHQLLHKHKNAPAFSKDLQVKKTEKPCCKIFDGITGDVLVSAVEYKTDAFSCILPTSNYSRIFSIPFFQFSNKAPPVVLA